MDHITPARFEEFLESAPGTQIIYAMGSNFIGACKKSEELSKLRDMAWRGRCCLTQRRVGSKPSAPSMGVYQYIATKSERENDKNRPAAKFYLSA